MEHHCGIAVEQKPLFCQKESLSRKQQSRKQAEAEASFQSYKGNGWINSRGSRYLATKGRKKIEPQREGCKTNQMFKTKEISVSLKVERKEITQKKTK